MEGEGHMKYRWNGTWLSHDNRMVVGNDVALREEMGIEAKLSTTYHPQTDGQTKVVNRCLEGYLRCMVMERPHTWVKWVATAEWWYNTSFHSSLGCTLFEALYGYRPLLHIPYIPRDATDSEIDEVMRDRDTDIGVLRQKVGAVAYRLDLPEEAHIHPVFHVSLLKGPCGSPEKIVPLSVEARFNLHPPAVLDRKLVKRGNKAVMKVLVHWKEQTTHDATWEFLDELKLRFPDFSELTLEDKSG
ncbi:uncharacterized protein LOC143618677 [Bidens hawaiensis]|uniref:uncharacterized protein LOC143618677 n=1 Tax=Bidens hawaiensis TaxID=980011 RepID=UPI004049887A